MRHHPSRRRRRSSKAISAVIERLEARRVLSTIYVDANPAITTHNGTSWSTAFADLQQALAAAASGDQIRVADGTYKPTATTARTTSFQLKSGVEIFGGYAGFGAADPDARDLTGTPSVLSGDIGVAGNTSDNSYHVVLGDNTNATAVLDGFRIRDANANGPLADDTYGGGLRNLHGSPTITNCTFSNNLSTRGAGIYNWGSVAPTISGCTFTQNTAGGRGGAIYNSPSTAPAILDCIFSQNIGGNGGGAIFNENNSATSITRCTFTRNSSGNSGGAIYNFQSSPQIRFCIFQGNTNTVANTGGGAVINSTGASPTFVNCLFVGNSATGTNSVGGAIFNHANSSPTLVHCTFSANRAPNGTGGAIGNNLTCLPALTNCILWGNSATNGPEIGNVDGASVASVSYSDVQGGYAGTGNVNLDPKFVVAPSPGADATWGTADDKYGSLKLQNSSFCIDAGSNAAVPAGVTTDLAGRPRIVDYVGKNDPNAIVDLGAYEVPYGVAVTVFVDANATGANDGASWPNAYVSLAVALTEAVNGTTVKIADGTYRPTTTGDPNQTFSLQTGVTWLGGFAGSGASNPDARDIQANVTILSGDIGTVGYTPDNSTHVIIAGGTSCTVDGVTITAGNAAFQSGAGAYVTSGSPLFNACTFSENLALQSVGGAAYVSPTSSPTFSACKFTANQAATGGAIYSYQATPTIMNCEFSSQWAHDGGGAIVNFESPANIIGCLFDSNTTQADRGGAIFHYLANGGSILNCTFIGNTSQGAFRGGGAIYCASSNTPITSCQFYGNTSTGGGGNGGAVWLDFSTSTLNGCTFGHNSVIGAADGDWGGAVAIFNTPATLVNCVFFANSADQGGAVTAFNCSPSVINCTFTLNAAASGGAVYNESASSLLRNNILWANTAASGSQIFTQSGSPTVSNCDVQGGFAGTGNIDADPLFVRNPSPGADSTWGAGNDDDYGDLRLQLQSLCVDAGSNAAVPAGVTTDIAGEGRFFDFPGAHDPGAIVDMGAHELGMRLGLLHVPAGQTLALPQGGYTFFVEQLQIDADATLDIKENKLVIDYSGPTLLGSWSGSAYTGTTGSIQSGRNGGTWDGEGIVTSMSNIGAGLRAVGVEEASKVLDIAGSETALWNGFTVDATAIIVKYTYMGDIDVDGDVDGDDYFWIDSNIAESGVVFGYGVGDIELDGNIDGDDYFWIDSNIAAAQGNGPI